jgi:hypothetical protein
MLYELHTVRNPLLPVTYAPPCVLNVPCAKTYSVALTIPMALCPAKCFLPCPVPCESALRTVQIVLRSVPSAQPVQCHVPFQVQCVLLRALCPAH